MVFVSNTFVFLFLPLFLGCYALTPARLRNLVILLFSWLFYAWWRLDFLPLIVSIAAWSWLTGLWIARATDDRNRRLAVTIGVAGPLAALCWFKYANLLVGTAGWIGMPTAGWEAVLLPIGLSFFVFGAISYSVDVYRGTVRAEPSFVNYATYQSMFGHLVAGPVVRYEWVAERLKERAFHPGEFAVGVQRFMLGFAQKVLLADTLAPLVHAGYGLAAPNSADAGISILAYAMQLYFDFAGYSHMAIGLGLMVGLRFPENFRHPYLSRSLPEFWRNWHISLSSWLRDYLYIPLGGNRRGLARGGINLLITMGLGGLWHGAGWTFLVWGLWHGAGLMAARFWRDASLPVLPAWFSHMLMLVFVMLGWALFRADDWHSFGVVMHGLAGANGIAFSGSFSAALRPAETAAMICGAILIYAPLAGRWSATALMAERRLAAWAALPLWLVALCVLQGRSVVPFLYFQF